MKTRYKYIHFKPCTGWWNCLNNKSGALLGVVEFYKSWKQFVFIAESEDCVFSADCLDDISDFIKQLTMP